MILPAFLCFLTIAASCAMLAPSEQVEIKPNAIGTDRRMRRALVFTSGAVTWGLRVVNRLLAGARPLPSDEVYRNFVKPGGWDKALKDFQAAMRDTDFKTSQMPKKLELYSGEVGDRFIFLKSHGSNGYPEIEIMKFKENQMIGRVFSGERIDRITYTD